MKKLLIPVIIAILAGVGGGSGFAYMSASKAYVVDSTHLADSLKAHPPIADSANADAHAEPAPSDAHDATAEASAPTNAATTSVPAAVTGHDSSSTSPGKSPPKAAATAHVSDDADAKPATSAVANIVRDARNEALNTALPEQRLAKIFAAMAAKDAAKVMDQMPDGDVRAILSLMNDRAAAAILVQFSPARAAALTKGAGHPTGSTP